MIGREHHAAQREINNIIEMMEESEPIDMADLENVRSLLQGEYNKLSELHSRIATLASSTTRVVTLMKEIGDVS